MFVKLIHSLLKFIWPRTYSTDFQRFSSRTLTMMRIQIRIRMWMRIRMGTRMRMWMWMMMICRWQWQRHWQLIPPARWATPRGASLFAAEEDDLSRSWLGQECPAIGSGLTVRFQLDGHMLRPGRAKLIRVRVQKPGHLEQFKTKALCGKLNRRSHPEVTFQQLVLARINGCSMEQ